MEIYRTEDGKVSKYIHNDGSETAVKTNNSCSNLLDANGNVVATEVDRNKYSVFISSSAGCPLGCKFCYLTTKKYPYSKLSTDQIVKNFKEALTDAVSHDSSIKGKYIKLSFMGMGDVFLLDPYKVRKASEEMLDWAVNRYGFAAGVDGVDMSTVLPNDGIGWGYQLAMLNDYVRGNYMVNPTVSDRSAVRLFYSMHSPTRRKSLIPCSKSNSAGGDLAYLNLLNKMFGIDIVIHYMLLKGINDKMLALSDTEQLIKSTIKNAEFRILRYNDCGDSGYHETDKFEEMVKAYSKALPFLKYQISSGSEIKAACGQFICRKMEKS